MQCQICRWIANQMLIILRIMTTIKCPGAFAEITVNKFGFIGRFILAHNYYFRLDIGFDKRSCLSHKSFYHLLMILTKHCWHWIGLGRKIKQGKEIILFLYTSMMSGINI